MALSYTLQTGDGSTKTFPFSFAGVAPGYFSKQDIHVFVDQSPVSFELTGTYQITITHDAPGPGSAVMIRRIMNPSNPLSQWRRGNTFTEKRLNDAFMYQLYLMHEVIDGFDQNEVNSALDMRGNKIINLAAGSAPSDAVNYGQVLSAKGELGALVVRAEQAAINAEVSNEAAAVEQQDAHAARVAAEASANSAADSAWAAKGSRDAAAASANSASISEQSAKEARDAAAASAAQSANFRNEAEGHANDSETWMQQSRYWAETINPGGRSWHKMWDGHATILNSADIPTLSNANGDFKDGLYLVEFEYGGETEERVQAIIGRVSTVSDKDPWARVLTWSEMMGGTYYKEEVYMSKTQLYAKFSSRNISTGGVTQEYCHLKRVYLLA